MCVTPPSSDRPAWRNGVASQTASCGLIEAVRLVPENGQLTVELFGELATLLAFGQGTINKHPQGDASGVQVTMVAGARSRRYLHVDHAVL